MNRLKCLISMYKLHNRLRKKYKSRTYFNVIKETLNLSFGEYYRLYKNDYKNRRIIWL